MVTIYDVAKEAGVSPSTVSNAINNNGKVSKKTTERIFQVIEKLNYVPNTMAKGLRASNSRNIHVLCEDVTAFQSVEIIDGISTICDRTNYKITLENIHISKKVKDYRYDEYISNPEFKASLRDDVKQMIASNACGIIYIGIYPHLIDDLFEDLPIPITYSYVYSHQGKYCINADDYQGAKLAMEYLIQQGHKKIGMICGTFDTLPTHKRMQAFQTALMTHQLPYVPEYVVDGNWDYQKSYDAAKKILTLPDPPTAIFAMSDIMAYGVLNAAADLGLNVPNDVSVHGFDDFFFSEMARPSLTSVAMPLYEIGKKAAEVEIDLIEKRTPDLESMVIKCTHVPRNTVAKCKTV